MFYFNQYIEDSKYWHVWQFFKKAHYNLWLLIKYEEKSVTIITDRQTDHRRKYEQTEEQEECIILTTTDILSDPV